MAQRVSLKLFILFCITCTTFILAERTGLAEAIENKSSTFSTQLNNRDDDNGTDSEIAAKIRAQRAAIDARDNRDAVATQTKSGAKQNSCDNDLRKCITNTCGTNYKKCETDSDITFSDKLNACRKSTNCTAHEFTLFTNEIKEDKKQEISLALYNQVLDCGNSYNDCIIQQCGPKFNKCLSKSNGDNAINACKQIAQSCTEADSGLVGRIGNVFGIVRQDAEKQIKADETKLQKLRDSMRNSCRTLGAMFDDRSLDCVFNVSFYAGDDQKTPKASKKLYAGSMFDCTPDWFGIDVTTFKENAYRLTRAQTAASSAMLGSGVGTAVGAITSGAIDRAIETKKAKDALKEAEKQNTKDSATTDNKSGQDNTATGNKNDTGEQQNADENKPKKGEWYQDADGNMTCNGNDDECGTPPTNKDNAKADPSSSESGNKSESANSAKPAENGGGTDNNGSAANNTTIEKLGPAVVADTPAPLPARIDNSEAMAAIKADVEKESKQQMQNCTDSGGTWDDKKSRPCSCDKKKGLTDDLKGFTCKCSQNNYTYNKDNNKCVSSAVPAKTTTSTSNTTTNKNAAKEKCEKSGGTLLSIGTCNCPRSKLLEENADSSACQCWEPYDNETIAYFDATNKRCYFTQEALDKHCKRDIRIVAPDAAKGAEVQTSPEKGCICPPPYEPFSESHPGLDCLEPL